MSNIEKRRSYTPRQARERRAYRLVVVGGVAGTVGVVGLLLSFVGIVSAGLPIIALIVAAICVVMFRSATKSN